MARPDLLISSEGLSPLIPERLAQWVNKASRHMEFT